MLLNDENKKAARDLLEKQYERAVPSQIPIHTVRSSYARMLTHAKLFNPGPKAFWACAKTGAHIKAKMSYRTVWNRDNTLNAAHIPVATLYCSACEKPPQVKAEDAIYADEIQTLAL